MAFRTNTSQQLSFMDSASGLTAREQKALDNSWAKIFADDIFPAIDEERFRVLYSTRSQSKFNTPVNICVGALIIKELFQLSDDDIVESLMLDVRYQYALHTTSYEEQPLSDKSLSRFRKYCYDYEATHNVDLLHDCVTDLGSKIAKMMKVSSRIRRMDSMMQNPSDPDATFREKARKKYRGYVANIDESVGKNGSIVTDYQFEKNTYSDSRFLKDSPERNGYSEESSTLVADGAYFSEDNQRQADKQNVRLVPTAITGTDVPDIYADYKLNDAGNRVVECPAGYAPKSSSCSTNGNGHIYASFPKEQCLNCPHKDECRVKEHKKVCSITISAKGQFRAQVKREMKTEEYRQLARIRHGVETVPSILRRVYQADRMSVRGCIPSRFFFGCKVAALNVRKLITFRKDRGHYAQNPILAI